MTRITCVIGELKEELQLAEDLLERLTGAVGASFAAAGINLEFDLGHRDVYRLLAEEETTSLDMHEALRRLTGNSPVATSIDRIGLVFSDRYEGGDGVLGVMFDRGFDVASETPVGDLEHGVTREGCAVFLDAIRAGRSGADVEREIEFTITHELGHVFNLWHTGLPRTFMTPSCPGNAYPVSDFVFREEQLRFLSQIDDSRVRPGGEKYGVRAGLGPEVDEPHECSVASNTQNSIRRLRLDIGITRRSFWFFEPVELEVALRRAARGPAVVLPDVLDPGYEAFRIWIREPNGVVRRYRAPQRYCSNVNSRRIAFAHPFRRDVTLFGQADGYTFPQPGDYMIWCDLRCSGRTIRSNRVRFHVRAPIPDSGSYRRLRDVCTDPEVARLLFYRSGHVSARVEQLLAALADGMSDRCAAATAINYALGRCGRMRDRGAWLAKAEHSRTLTPSQRRIVRKERAILRQEGGKVPRAAYL